MRTYEVQESAEDGSPGGGRRQVRGWVYGLFAVRKLDWGKYTIDHLPTGLGLGPLFDRLRDARAVIERLSEGIDWNVVNPIPETHHQRMREVREWARREKII